MRKGKNHTLKNRLKCKLFFAFLLLLVGGSVQAQRGYTMNFMSQIPQQSKYNPAYYTCYKTYIGFPGLSGVQVQVNNDFLSISRLGRRGDSSFIIDVNKFVSSAFNNNNIGFEVSEDLINFGFKINDKNQIHFALGVEGYANLQITKNTLNFLLRGPGLFIGKGETEALSGNSIDFNLYGVVSLGYARRISKDLSIGARFKLLSGITNVYTSSSKVNVKIDDGHDPFTTPYRYDLKPEIALQGSFRDCPEDSNMFYALRNLQEIGSAISMPEKITDNLGMAFDIGATYDISEDLSLGASVYDIGSITWNKGLKKIESSKHEKSFVFKGVGTLNDIIKDDNFDVKNALTSLADSAKNYFQLNAVDSTFSSYKSRLRTSFNISAFYNLTDNDQLGVMWNQQMVGQKNRAITIAYTRLLGKNFSVSLNNAIVNENLFNFGGGFAMNFGGLQLYLIVDKISSHRVVDMRAVNLQLGINIVLNYLDKDPNKRRRVRDYTPRDKTGYVNDRWAR